METVWLPLAVQNTEFPYDPAIPQLGTYPHRTKSGAHTNTCTEMFTTAPLHKSQEGNNPDVHPQTNLSAQ